MQSSTNLYIGRLDSRSFIITKKNIGPNLGLRSESTDLGLGTFGTGITSAHFHSDGMTPWAILALKIEQIQLDVCQTGGVVGH